MPCYTIQLTSIKWSQNTNIDALKQAIKTLYGFDAVLYSNNCLSFGYQGENFNPQTGVLTLNARRNEAELKRAYSTQVMLLQAKKYGWQVKQLDANKYQVMKR
jgi:hypothetical protein